MNLPAAFLLGVAALLVSSHYCFVLPGSGFLSGALLTLPALALPGLLSGLSVQAIRRRLKRVSGEGKDPHLSDRYMRLLQRLSVIAVPLAYATFLVPGGYLDLVDQWSGESYLARVLLLLAPLLCADSVRIAIECRGVGSFADEAVRRDFRTRLAIIGLFTMPWILLATVGDVVGTNREVSVFLLSTSIGSCLGVLAFVLMLGLLLPIAFRFLFGLTSRLPEPQGEELRLTAAALGFSRRAVLWFDSGLRTVNALLVGPLPWPRYLVLTDGLAAVLDTSALRGVVAHEVGHAQAGHPALLLAMFVAVPVLLLPGLAMFDPLVLTDVQWFMVALAVGALSLWLLRLVAHRFEHEADVLSSVALGGAEPCIQALQRVGRVIQQEPERASMLHPSEKNRVDLLRRFAGDPQFRARFTIRGLRLRRLIVAGLLGSALVAGWSWYAAWPLEKAAVQYQVGDLKAARAQMKSVGNDVPAADGEWWKRFREDLEAASVVAGDGGDWETVRPLLAREGWKRGVATLLAEGPVRARPWFALAVQSPGREPLRESLLLYCEAALEQDAPRMREIAAHIRTLQPTSELTSFFGP